jgi:hypothetical protein
VARGARSIRFVVALRCMTEEAQLTGRGWRRRSFGGVAPRRAASQVDRLVMHIGRRRGVAPCTGRAPAMMRLVTGRAVAVSRQRDFRAVTVTAGQPRRRRDMRRMAEHQPSFHRGRTASQSQGERHLALRWERCVGMALGARQTTFPVVVASGAIPRSPNRRQAMARSRTVTPATGQVQVKVVLERSPLRTTRRRRGRLHGTGDGGGGCYERGDGGPDDERRRPQQPCIPVIRAFRCASMHGIRPEGPYLTLTAGGGVNCGRSETLILGDSP